MTPLIAVAIPSRASVTAATEAGPPPARIILSATTRSSSPGYLSTRAIVSTVITPTHKTFGEFNFEIASLRQLMQ